MGVQVPPRAPLLGFVVRVRVDALNGFLIGRLGEEEEAVMVIPDGGLILARLFDLIAVCHRMLKRLHRPRLVR